MNTADQSSPATQPLLKKNPIRRLSAFAGSLLLILVIRVAPPAWTQEPPLPMGLEETEEKPEEPAPPEGLNRESNEPALPEGLGEGTSEPDLPAGLGGESDEPDLPSGLEGLDSAEGETEDAFVAPPDQVARSLEPNWLDRIRDDLPFKLNGFWEVRGGMRVRDDPTQDDMSIAETRLQLEVEKAWRELVFKSTTDFLYDDVLDSHRIRLEEGDGFMDIRELSVLWRPNRYMDIKGGRQILTWGTGDLLFLNDLFPKDWRSFFIGRDEEYLKAPSDALKTSFFTDWVNLDLVYVPAFDADRFIDGRRISYYNPMLGRTAGQDAIAEVHRPNRWFRDDEFAGRLYKNIGGYELAAYGYKGFWKSPGGSDRVTGRGTFPELGVYGASVRRTLGPGVANAEIAYYDSEDDRSGESPFVRNSEMRYLVGYEQEIARDFTAGVQYYVEHMMDHDVYERTLPRGMPEADEVRHVTTLRLTKLLMNQNLNLSWFTYYSPSDHDVYFRPKASYKITDAWTVEGGANLFYGDERHTFFGQFEDNSNVYMGLRWSF